MDALMILGVISVIRVDDVFTLSMCYRMTALDSKVVRNVDALGDRFVSPRHSIWIADGWQDFLYPRPALLAHWQRPGKRFVET
nr:hypothetical protein [Pseudomonas syringae]